MTNEDLHDLLATNEVVLVDARQHWMAAVRFALRPLALLAVAVVLYLVSSSLPFDGAIIGLLQGLLLLLAVVSLIWLPIDLVRWRSRKYVLTDRRIIRLEGVLRKSSFDSSLEMVNDIETSQSVLGRALGYIDLTIYTASDTENQHYPQLIDGLEFKKAVLDAKEALRAGSTQPTR